MGGHSMSLAYALHFTQVQLQCRSARTQCLGITLSTVYELVAAAASRTTASLYDQMSVLLSCTA
jgi:hypothetical protein